MKKYLVHAVVLSCKKATELLDKQSLFELRWLERTQLRWHKSICNSCKRYEKQSALIDHILRNALYNPEDINIPIVRNEELEKKILSRL